MTRLRAYGLVPVVAAVLVAGGLVIFAGCSLNAAGDSVLNVLPNGGFQIAVRTELQSTASDNMALASQTIMPQGGGGGITTDIPTTPAFPNPGSQLVQLPGVPTPAIGPGKRGTFIVAVTAPSATADPPGPPAASDLGDAAGLLTSVMARSGNVAVTPASTDAPLLFGPATGGWGPTMLLVTNMTVEKSGASQELNSISLASDQVGAIPDALITLPADRGPLSDLRVVVDPASVPSNYVVTVQAVATVKQTDGTGAILDDGQGDEAEGVVTGLGTGAVGESIPLTAYTWTSGVALAANTNLSNDRVTADTVGDPNNTLTDTLGIAISVSAP